MPAALPDIAGQGWRQVPWAGHYWVSPKGEVGRRINVNHPERRQFLVLRQYADKDGYLYIRLDGVKWLVHRLVYAVFVGKLQPGLVVCHRDGSRTNNLPSNLLQASQRENISHKQQHGTWQFGELHPRSLVTDSCAALVKQMIGAALRSTTGRLRRGESKRIADEAGVSVHLVQSISSAKAWHHV